ncbi:MAG: phosphotransferase [Actinomycetota bacterium]|nr:phosphotransferase [Actinomycetota bacterium]
MADAVGVGSRVVSVRRLGGGGWHANHAVDVVDRRGEKHRLVLRRWARPGWEILDPDFNAHRELATYRLLAESDVPAPRLVAADPDVEACDVPALLITRLRGRQPRAPREMRAFLAQLASALVPIHAVDATAAAGVPAYRRYHETTTLAAPAWASNPRVWTRAIEAVTRAEPSGRRSFIHRDYHPGNTLWSRGRLTAVVDWTSGSVGSPAVDTGHMRWNLAVEYGLDAADQFLELYREVMDEPVEDQPYWDLVTAYDVAAGDMSSSPREELLRLEQHVAAAVARV